MEGLKFSCSFTCLFGLPEEFLVSDIGGDIEREPLLLLFWDLETDLVEDRGTLTDCFGLEVSERLTECWRFFFVFLPFFLAGF